MVQCERTESLVQWYIYGKCRETFDSFTIAALKSQHASLYPTLLLWSNVHWFCSFVCKTQKEELGPMFIIPIDRESLSESICACSSLLEQKRSIFQMKKIGIDLDICTHLRFYSYRRHIVLPIFLKFCDKFSLIDCFNIDGNRFRFHIAI